MLIRSVGVDGGRTSSLLANSQAAAAATDQSWLTGRRPVIHKQVRASCCFINKMIEIQSKHFLISFESVKVNVIF